MLDFITQKFKENANFEKAFYMEAYMKHNFKFYGVNAPIRKEIGKVVWKEIKQKPIETNVILINNLMQLNQREYHQLASDLSSKITSKLDLTHLINIQNWIITHSWWDTVDPFATNTLGPFMLKWNALEKLTPWLESENIWLNRSALICQLKYKQKTNLDFLEMALVSLLPKKTFFIQKAIGWALREYAKTNPSWTIQFVNKFEVTGLAKREALRIITKNK